MTLALADDDRNSGNMDEVFQALAERATDRAEKIGPPGGGGNAGAARGGGEGAALQAKLEAGAERAAREFHEAEGSGR